MLTNDQALKVLRAHVSQLMEHFDTVQIFVTKHKAEIGTFDGVSGEGNWYARRGLVQEWLESQDEGIREEVRIRNDDEGYSKDD